MAKKYQLKNGLKVLLIESHKSPVVSVQMWVRNGSADERKGEEGISHFIEHLVFKGSRSYGVGEIAQIVESNGGELNAYTSFDQTVFYVTISNQFKDVALKVISEMMGYPNFDPIEINNEREVVIEEIKRGNDSPQRKASQLFFETVYPTHPYGIPVIGYDTNIKSVSVKKIKDYYQSKYSPNNMFLVVSGDFKSSEMKKKVTEIFSEIKKHKIRKSKRPKVTEIKKPQIAVEKTSFQQGLVYIGWPGPNVKHKDVPGLDLLSMILGQGDSSRLVNKLRIKEPLVNGVGAFAFTPQDNGVFAISLSLQQESLEKALAEITKELIEIQENPPTQEEMQKALTIISSEQAYSVETVEGIAQKAGSLEFFMNDPEYYKKYLKEIYKLKPENILKLAQKYLDPQKIIVTAAVNEDEEKIKTIVENFVKNYKEELNKNKLALKKIKKNLKPKKFKVKKIILASKGQKTEPQTKKVNFKNGLTVFMRPQFDTPTVSLKAAYLGGLRIEGNRPEGLSEMFSRSFVGGTKNISEEQLNHEMDMMASSLSAFAGRNSVGLGLEYLKTFEQPSLHLFQDALLNPAWSLEVIEREKTVLANQIKSRDDKPSQQCFQQFTQQIFAGHPYHRDMMGTQDSIAKISQSDIANFYNEMKFAKNLMISVVGDFDTKKMTSFFEKLDSQLPAGKRQNQTFELKNLSENKKIFKALNKEQAHVALGYRGPSLTDEDRFTLQIIESILAGQGGRLFIELRDKKSLAYTVSPIRMHGIEGGYFGAYIGCSPEKVDTAISMMQEELKKLMDNKISKEELLRAQKYLIGRHDIDLQRKSAISSSILFDEIYGIDSKINFHLADKFYAINEENIMSLSQRLFSQKYVLSVVGPEGCFKT